MKNGSDGRFERIWTDPMIEDFKRLYKDGMLLKQIATTLSTKYDLSITLPSVKWQRHALGLIRQPHVKWTPEADSVLYSHCHTMTDGQLIAEIKKRSGLDVTPYGIEARMRYLGITVRDAGDPIFADVAAELGISEARLSQYVKCKGLEVYGGRYRHVPPATLKKLHKAFPRITVPTMSTLEVARALHVSQESVRRWCRGGLIPATPFGNSYKIPVSAVEAKRRELGITRPIPQTFGRKDVA
jgi:excisionase family DNA binding protein